MSIAIKRLSKEDFEVNTIEERMKVVNDIIFEHDDELVDYYDNYYNPSLTQNGKISEFDSVSKDLEKLADYLLYAESKEKRKDKHGEDFSIMSGNDSDKNKKKEFLTDEVISVSEGQKRVHQHKLYKSVKVNKKDREEHMELKETGIALDEIKKMVDTKIDSKGNYLDEDQIRKLKWIAIEVRKDEVAIKESLKGYIRFKRLSPEGGMAICDGFSFGNIEHIRVIIENYSELKENSYDDTHGDIKHIIQVFEELVDKTSFEDYMKDILIFKIDGMTRKQIVDILYDKYSISFSEERVSQITKDIIPSMIIETYNIMKEEWIYTFIIKGNYKTCRKCNKTKLTKYFGVNKRSKDGLNSSCKSCRNK